MSWVEILHGFRIELDIGGKKNTRRIHSLSSIRHAIISHVMNVFVVCVLRDFFLSRDRQADRQSQ